MNFDDKLVDATIWECIEWSNNPHDFSSYLEHRLANAAHLDDAATRYKELVSADKQTEAMFPKAVTKIEQMAIAGDSTAQFHMGKFYSEGHGVQEDFAAAARWYELAASQGEFRAAHNLANLKLAGKGIPQDVDGAISLYEKGIAAGDPTGAENRSDSALVSVCYQAEFPMSARGRLGEVANGSFVAVPFEKHGFG